MKILNISIFLLFTINMHADDIDLDLIPDDFELANGLNVGLDDRYKDLDGDGYPNLAEYLHETDPSDEEDFPQDVRVVGSANYPELLDALDSSPPPPGGTIVLLPPGRHQVGIVGLTLPNNIFIIAQSADAFATVVELGEAATTSSVDLIVAEGDIYLDGLTLVGRGPECTAVKMVNSGGYSAFLRCVFLEHAAALQSGTSVYPCSGRVDVDGCLVMEGVHGGSGRCYALKLHGNHEVHMNFSTVFGLGTSLTTGNDGMAIWLDGAEASVEVRNSILWNTGDAEIWLADSTPDLDIAHSYIRGSAASAGTESDLKLRQGFLLADSPCIDAASGTDPRPNSDIRGNARLEGTAPDMGAHEFFDHAEGVWGDDVDGDGVSDWHELTKFLTQFYRQDSDLDGVNDGADANPTNSAVQQLRVSITNPAAANE